MFPRWWWGCGSKILALYAFDRSYTPPSQDKAGFTLYISWRYDYMRGGGGGGVESY